MYVVAALLLLMELMGYVSAICACVRIQSSFVPAVVTTTITLFVFSGGMLGCLDAAVLVAHIGGIVLFICSIVLRKLRNAFLRVLRDPGIVFFCVGAVLIFVLLPNATYSHYDDFSHWGTIVKDMFSSHSFPGDGSTVSRIGLFANYPPATASFVYWADSLLKYTEGHAIVAQNILLLSALSALFGGIRRPLFAGEIVLCTMIALGFLFVIGDSFPLFLSLLTDIVMGALVVAAISLVVFNRYKLLRSALLATPVIVVAAFVKDNGKLYLALFLLALVALLLVQRKSQIAQLGKRKAFWKGLLCVAIPSVVFLVLNTMWGMHVDSAFAAGFDSGKFAVSAEKLLQGPTQSIVAVAKRVMYEAFFLKLSRSAIFWGLNTVVILILVVEWRRGAIRSDLACFALIGNGAIFITCFALVILYSFFMPAAESKAELAGFTRYYGTALLIFYGLACRGIVSWLYCCPFRGYAEQRGSAYPNAKRKRIAMSIGAGSLIFLLALPGLYLFATGGGLGQLEKSAIVSKPTYSKLREPISSVLNPQASPIPSDVVISVYYGKEINESYTYYVSLHESGDVVCALSAATDSGKAFDDLKKSEWLVFVGADEQEFFSYFEDLGINFTSKKDVRYFRIEHDAENKMRLSPM
ncbi:hypothetical protein [Adlercreutzia caecimuris]|uniref:hypothetical protein n=1 Tax=Adlercreutzia caecimuris TaxID=671266 RepID=UPI001372F693|nr:hypothetical protein [Adlercreutzia caecimuris]NBJ67790.1 hypothetical protein [Adlercreutzia caecimuris]